MATRVELFAAVLEQAGLSPPAYLVSWTGRSYVATVMWSMGACEGHESLCEVSAKEDAVSTVWDFICKKFSVPEWMADDDAAPLLVGSLRDMVKTEKLSKERFLFAIDKSLKDLRKARKRLRAEVQFLRRSHALRLRETTGMEPDDLALVLLSGS